MGIADFPNCFCILQNSMLVWPCNHWAYPQSYDILCSCNMNNVPSSKFTNFAHWSADRFTDWPADWGLASWIMDQQILPCSLSKSFRKVRCGSRASTFQMLTIVVLHASVFTCALLTSQLATKFTYENIGFNIFKICIMFKGTTISRLGPECIDLLDRTYYDIYQIRNSSRGWYKDKALTITMTYDTLEFVPWPWSMVKVGILWSNLSIVSNHG